MKVGHAQKPLTSTGCVYSGLLPENAIGRVSRMDAINNRSVNEAALRQVEKQLAGLERAMGRLNNDRFGLCHRCGEAIPYGRILLLPGAISCVRCSD